MSDVLTSESNSNEAPIYLRLIVNHFEKEVLIRDISFPDTKFICHECATFDSSTKVSQAVFIFTDITKHEQGVGLLKTEN